MKRVSNEIIINQNIKNTLISRVFVVFQTSSVPFNIAIIYCNSPQKFGFIYRRSHHKFLYGWSINQKTV